MGKEQDLIQAAKSGNVAHIEKILGNKARKSGIQSFISRTINPNYQDELGNTPLHYAALNGHSASNGTEDTALHSAAQFGFSLVVAVLLENHADPCICNSREESPLDLAAQYGKMETCATGTALHEAVLFGKVDVVNLLLQCGIDVTIVDSKKNTVLDLLALHPSAKAREIKELIYELQHPRNPNGGLRKVNTFHVRGSRPSSEIYPRNYDIVPNPLPYHQGMGANVLRRSGSYDTVPSPRSKESLQNRASYDTVPSPKATPQAFPVDWTKFDRGKDDSQALSSAEGHALPGPTEETDTGRPHVLTPQVIQSDYDLVGAPTQEPTNSRPDSTYALVGPGGTNVTPVQTAGDDYAVVGIPIGGGDGSTSLPTGRPSWLLDKPGSSTRDEAGKQADSSVPIRNSSSHNSRVGLRTAKGQEGGPVSKSGMGSRDNPNYLVKQSNAEPPPPQLQNDEVYDFVQPKRSQVSASQPSVYEVPPSMTLPGRGNGPVTTDATAARSSRGQPSDFYENTNIMSSTQGTQQAEIRRKYDYDLVSFPARKATLERPAYDIVPPPNQVPQYKASAISGERCDAESTAQTQSVACPLVNLQGDEVVDLRRSAPQAIDSDPEMQPFASRPGYLPMGPPQDEYEKVSAPTDLQEQLRNSGGVYETLSMSSPQIIGSQTEPSPRNFPTARPLYEVPPSKSSPVYEIAPPPRNFPAAPSRIPRESPLVQSPPEVQRIEKEPPPPKAPRRRQNDYSEWPTLSPPGKSSKPDPYETIRIEGPSKEMANAIDWEKVKEENMQRYGGGEYCTLSPTSVGPENNFNRGSISSSERSSVTEPVMTPPFSPPSPGTAVASIFETLGTMQSSEKPPTIPEMPEDDRDQKPADQKRMAPIPKPRKRLSQNLDQPKILPRSDSLLDDEFVFAPGAPEKTAAIEAGNQDLFSCRPSAETVDASAENTDMSAENANVSPKKGSEENALHNKREEPDGAEMDSEVTSSPLIYENVLFKRKGTVENGAKNDQGNSDVQTRDESDHRPVSYRLSMLSTSSPMDEREEWEKIEAFLSSIGQIVPQTLEEQMTQAGMADSVPAWLKALDLGQYESLMMANGFDNIHFLIGIVDFSHRRTIMEAMKSLPACPRLSDLVAPAKPESLRDWLKLICLLEYFPVFQQNGFDSMERLHMLWEVELTSVLEINSLGHRKRILASLKEDVKELDMEEQTESTNLETSSAHLEQQLAELKLYCPDEKPDQPIALTRSRKYTNELMATAEQMVANAKEQVAKQVSKGKNRDAKRWKHDSFLLIEGSVNYTTLYLGSHAVKTITGLESTIEACRKMRLSTEKLQKIPSVILSVSIKGIKFIDARSKILVSNHEMRNISYITQDPEDRRVFAYIAKDAKTDKHYCHVFRMDVIVSGARSILNSPLSDEVTMTIGQAFEVIMKLTSPSCLQYVRACQGSSPTALTKELRHKWSLGNREEGADVATQHKVSALRLHGEEWWKPTRLFGYSALK
ncbi:Ankyrin repeat and SAM domain-containing protein 1A [Acropora cervicornis]|uniref:Ankyrin repeat and SAM domain-containing protein 1A n=1 Tax=Acropora cervicornis TaxID=6130 RepID=A0AAD9QQI6_ACRCE|nr:Ankyrin repeat and SAM domain-containing protein 1A [Acropora cervicornis]